MAIWLFLIVIFMDSNFNEAADQYLLGCYYDNSALTRQSEGRDRLDHYIPGLCTHIIFAFAGMNESYEIEATYPTDISSADIPQGMYKKVNDFKKLQPGLKTLLSFGGYVFTVANKGRLRSMISSRENRKKFTESAIMFIRKHNFDGFNIHWEYPETEDRDNLSILFEEMSPKFRSSGLMLTATVSPKISAIDAGYNVPVMASAISGLGSLHGYPLPPAIIITLDTDFSDSFRTLDFIDVRSFDLHGFWEPRTGFNSPLFGRNDDHLSMSDAANYWVSKGMPKKKIMLSFATFGRSFTLLNPTKTGIGVEATSDRRGGRYTRIEGLLAYYEICERNENDLGQCYIDHSQEVPYIVDGNTWTGYDNTHSFRTKASWLKTNKFGGAIAFSLDLDDYMGMCKWSNGQQYPLIRTLNNELLGNSTKGMQPLGNKEPYCCSGEGLYSDPTNCHNYYYNCRLLSCGECLVFNSVKNICDFRERFPCNETR